MGRWFWQLLALVYVLLVVGSLLAGGSALPCW